MQFQPTALSPQELRFWAKVQATPDSCWRVMRGLTGDGYSQLRLPAQRRKNPVYGHRYSYELFCGPIPSGLELDHLCCRSNCINPKHLEAVPHSLNILRGKALNPQNGQATKKYCPQGHRYDEANTYIRKKGWRRCRACACRLSTQYRAKIASEK